MSDDGNNDRREDEKPRGPPNIDHLVTWIP